MGLFAIYRRLLAAQLRSQLQFRASFAIDLLGSALVMVLEFSALALVFGRFDGLGGWSLGEVAFLYGLVEIAFGLMDMIFGGFDPQRFGTEVRRGSFDQLMLRPLPLALQVLGSDFALRRLGRVGVGVAIFAFALSLNPVVWTVGKLLYLPLVIVAMVLFFGGLFIVGATITFWTIESIEAMNVLTYGGSLLISYPMHIYDTWLRRSFTFILPAAFLNYYPSLYFLDRPDVLGMPGFAAFLAPLAGGLLFAAALAFWRFGLRHYQSTGT
jgi:ABC-2 type transport system permease protein